MAGDIRHTSKRAPVVFCLDVTGSMNLPEIPGSRRIDVLNTMIQGLFDALLKDPNCRSKVEVAFVIFTHKILMETAFINIASLQMRDFENIKVQRDYVRDNGMPCFELHKLKSNLKPDGFLYPQFDLCERDDGTDIGYAVLHSVKKLMDHRDELTDWGGSYPGTLILVTDGDAELSAVDRNPNRSEEENRLEKERRLDNQEKAIQTMIDHCYTHSNQGNLILPFIIGVSADEKCNTELDRYAGEFLKKAFHVEDSQAESCFKIITKMIGKSVKASMNINEYTEILEDIKKDTERINNKDTSNPTKSTIPFMI